MISIKPVSEEDKIHLYNLTRNNVDRLMDFFPITVEKTETPEKTLEAIKLYRVLASQSELYVMLMEADDDKRKIGTVFIKNIDKKVSKCEIAYFIDKNEEGKNYTTEAVKKTLDIIFDHLKFNKVYCRIATDNVGSNRVAQKAGFVLEGTLKQEFRIGNGSLIDINYYGLLRENYN